MIKLSYLGIKKWLYSAAQLNLNKLDATMARSRGATTTEACLLGSILAPKKRCRVILRRVGSSQSVRLNTVLFRRVVDGDTLVLENKYEIRLIGIIPIPCSGKAG